MKIGPKSLTVLFQNSSFVRFLLVGVWNAFFSLFLFYLLIFFLGDKEYELVLFVTFAFSTLQSYSTQKFLVWRQREVRIREFSHFLATSIGQYLLNALFMFLLVSEIHLSPKFVQVPVSFAIAIGSYLYFKNKVFK